MGNTLTRVRNRRGRGPKGGRAREKAAVESPAACGDGQNQVALVPHVPPKTPLATTSPVEPVWSVLEEPNGRALKDLYILRGKIGQGAYGQVQEGVHRDTRARVAVKSVLKKNMRRLETLRREIGIMRKLEHPNIIRLLDAFEDNSFFHIVMEICDGGELFDRITAAGAYSEENAKCIAQQILNAVAYLHEHKVAHRDLKPENFLFESARSGASLKLIDFGLSRFCGTNDESAIMKTRVGTPYYIAPEVLRKEYDCACDVWSVGVIMYILLCGYPPFYGNSEKEIYDSVKKGSFNFPKSEWDVVSNEAKDLIKRLLEFNPKNRITAYAALQHKWFVETNLSHVVRGASESPEQRPLDRSVYESSASETKQSNSTAGETEQAGGEEDITLVSTNSAPKAQIDVTGLKGTDVPQAHTLHAPISPTRTTSTKTAAIVSEAQPSHEVSRVNRLAHGHNALAQDATSATTTQSSRYYDAFEPEGFPPEFDPDNTASFIDVQTKASKSLDPHLLSRLRRFAKANKFKQAALGIIVRYLNQDEIMALSEQFAIIDTDESGTISLSELEDAMRKAGLDLSADEISKLLEEVDVDKNGIIDYEEFTAAGLSRNVYLRNELLESAFQYFDAASTGEITVDDLRVRMASKDSHSIEAVLREFDLDHSGTINLDEFKKMMQGSPAEVELEDE